MRLYFIIDINDVEIELTPEEAKELYDTLSPFFTEKTAKDILRETWTPNYEVTRGNEDTTPCHT